MKKYLQIFAINTLALLTLTACGGGGGASQNGNQPPTPTASALIFSAPSVEADNIATLTALAVDANGKPLSGVPVKFTVASGNGTLSVESGTTDHTGVVGTTLMSDKTGFVSVKAAASGLSKQVTIYFTQALTAADTLKMSIDADADGNFNQPSDFYLPADGKTTATIRAQVLDAAGQPIAGKTIIFSSDRSGVSFASGINTAITDDKGMAMVSVSVDASMKNDTNIVLILAAESAGKDGAHNMLSFYLEPLQVQTLEFSWHPASIKVGGSATITVYPLLADGKTPPPDGTIINMFCTLGSCPPVGALQSGQYVTTFTSDGTAGNAIITTSVGGVTKVFPIAVTN